VYRLPAAGIRCENHRGKGLGRGLDRPLLRIIIIIIIITTLFLAAAAITCNDEIYCYTVSHVNAHPVPESLAPTLKLF